VSIVRIGMSEDSKFGDGYDAIFGKQEPASKTDKKPAAKKPVAKKPTAKKKPAAKKPAKKK
jgi:hypothetical protein